jgi:hypothetical protein
MTPNVGPQSRLVFSTPGLRVLHVGDAAHLTTRGWPLVRTRRDRDGIEFWFPLDARKDLELFRIAMDAMRAEAARAHQQHQRSHPRSGEANISETPHVAGRH